MKSVIPSAFSASRGKLMKIGGTRLFDVSKVTSLPALRRERATPRVGRTSFLQSTAARSFRSPSLARMLLACCFTAAISTTSSSAVAASDRACVADALRLRVEHVASGFAGMSHDGAVAVLRNVGVAACEIPAIPASSMLDARGVPVAAGAPLGVRFMHPGPVILPILLEAGAEAAAPLRWIDANVFGTEGRAVDVRTFALTIGDHIIRAPLRTTMWGATRTTLGFESQRYTTALPALDAASAVTAGTFVGEGPAGSTLMLADRPARKLEIRRATDASFAFSFSGLGGEAPNVGELRGILAPNGTTATFRDPNADCALIVRGYGQQLEVSQRGGCGFGNAVTATGRYRRVDVRGLPR